MKNATYIGSSGLCVARLRMWCRPGCNGSGASNRARPAYNEILSQSLALGMRLIGG